MDIATTRPPSIDTIKRMCAGVYGITLIDMDSRRRDRRTAHARHLAMWLTRELTSHTAPVIGRHFGNRNHTTVLDAIRKVDGMLDWDPALRSTAHDLRDALKLPAEQVTR